MGKMPGTIATPGVKKTKQTSDVLASIPMVEDDQRIIVQELAAMHGLPVGTVHAILNDHFGLVKKSACWVHKLL
jgi:hypothetical protein